MPRSRIDDAVRRILTKKFELGLFEHPFTDRTQIGRDRVAPRTARSPGEAVAESQVLLKNAATCCRSGGPATSTSPARNADDIGNQAGGWTLTWQGGSTNVIPGTTILDGIREAAPAATGYLQRRRLGADRPRDVGVVVVGETPYAEGFGDVGGPQWALRPRRRRQAAPVKDMQLSRRGQAAVDRVCAGPRCVVLVVSGRPLIIDPQQLATIDALVASWLPGTEGAGVADILFGTRPFTGKLPVTWPGTVAQEPVNVGDPNYDPLYPYGWGLRTR